MNKELQESVDTDINYNNVISNIIESIRKAINHTVPDPNHNYKFRKNEFDYKGIITSVIDDFEFEINIEKKKFIVKFILGNYPCYTKKDEIFIFTDELNRRFLYNQLWYHHKQLYISLAHELTHWIDKNLDKIKTKKQFNSNDLKNPNLYKEYRLEPHELNANFRAYISKEFNKIRADSNHKDKILNNRQFLINTSMELAYVILGTPGYLSIPFSDEELKKYKRQITKRVADALYVFAQNPYTDTEPIFESFQFTESLIIYGKINYV